MVIVPTILDSVERVARSARAPRGAGARQPRSAHPLRPPQRLPRRRRPRRCRTTPRFSTRRAPASTRSTRSTATAAPTASSCSTACGSGTSSEGLWMGWERKRGKIEEFNRLLRGATDTSFAVQRRRPVDPAAGALLHHARQRHAPAARRRARADRHHHASAEPADVRSDGRPRHRGLRHPAAARSASRSRARPARCSRGSTPGTPASIPYTTAVSDTYQDLFGEGIFTGKGLYDVDAFMAALEDSVPENALLSHDLFEGLHARVALVSDVELVDEYPSSVLDARAAPAPLDPRRLADPVLAVPVRAVAPRAQAQHAAAHRPLEDPRQPAPQPGRADAAGAARRRLDGAAGPALVLDGGGARRASRRSCCRSLARLLVGPRRAQSIPVFLRNLRDDAADRARAGRCSA